jgi:Uma2 family endonuclease
MSVEIAKRPFTADEYERMTEAGILSEDDRVELIEGEIVEMSPIGRRHAACVNRLNQVFTLRAGRDVIVGVQNPVRLDEFSEPEPDIALLRPREDFYEGAHPTPADVLLIVEVADTSVEYDRQVKVPLYARAGVVEVWLVDLSQETIEIFVRPVSGEYQSSRIVSRGETIEPQSVPRLSLNAEDILG